MTANDSVANFPNWWKSRGKHCELAMLAGACYELQNNPELISEVADASFPVYLPMTG